MNTQQTTDKRLEKIESIAKGVIFFVIAVASPIYGFWSLGNLPIV